MTTLPPDDQSRFDRLMEEYLDRLRRGERPDPERYAAEHPDLAADIHRVFPTLYLLEEFGPASGPSKPPHPPAPQHLGEYLILREVGRGGMGVVYEAVQESLGRHVALKVLTAGAALRGDLGERFRREAQAAARLHHTNIVPVFAVGEQDGTRFYAMQFIRGQSFAAVLDELRALADRPTRANTVPTPAGDTRRDGPPSSGVSHITGGSPSRREYFRNVARLGAQLADALDHAHRAGVIHRDVKPSNLLLAADGVPWVADFGLAQTTDTDGLTLTGAAVGTPAYMAPEQFDGKADRWTDVYGLGVTLYELLTFQPAFRDEVRVRLVDRVRREEPPRPRTVAPDVPRDLETVVLKAMAKEPIRRYQTAAELADDLRRFADGRTVLARRPSWVSQAWRWCKRNPAVSGLLAAVFGLLVTVIVVVSIAAVRERVLNRELTDALGRVTDAQAGTEQANRQLRESLRDGYFSLAREVSLRPSVGRRAEALEYLRRAADLRPGDDLREFAIRTLTLPDLRVTRSFPRSQAGRPWEGRLVTDYTPDLSHFSDVDAADLLVRAVGDGGVTFRLTLAGRKPTGVRFSRDGRYLAAGFDRGPTRFEVWEWAAARRVYQSEDKVRFRSFDFSVDHTTVAVGTEGGFLRYVDLTTGAATDPVRVGDPQSQPFAPWIVHYSPDGTHLLFAPVQQKGPNGWAVLKTGQTNPTLVEPSNGTVYHAVWMPDSRGLLLSMGLQVFIRPFAPNNPAATPWLPKLTLRQPARGFTFDRVGNLLAVDQGPRGPTLLYDLRDWSLALEAPDTIARFHPDGRRVGLTGDDHVRIAEVLSPVNATPSPARLPGRYVGIQLIPLAHPDTVLSCGTQDSAVFDLGTTNWTPLSPLFKWGGGVAVDTTGGHIAVTSGNTLHSVPARLQEGTLTLGPPRVVFQPTASDETGVTCTPDGRLVAVRRGKAVEVRTAAGRVILSVPSSGQPESVSFSPDGRWFVARRLDPERVVCYSTETGQHHSSVPFAGVQMTWFEPYNSDRLLVYHRDGHTVLNPADGVVSGTHPPPAAGAVLGLISYSPDGRLVAVPVNKSRVDLVRAGDGRRLGTLPQDSTAGPIRSQFTVDGRRLLVTMSDFTTQVWDLVALRQELRAIGLDWPDDEVIPRVPGEHVPLTDVVWKSK